MHKNLTNKQPALVNEKHPIILNNNARPHIARNTLQKFNELKYKILPHPPYSPDLSSTYYHLSKYLNQFLQHQIIKNQLVAEKAL